MKEPCAELLHKNGIPFAVLIFYYNIGISSTLFLKGEKKDGIMSHNLENIKQLSCEPCSRP